jgi:hypothetical protein
MRVGPVAVSRPSPRNTTGEVMQKKKLIKLNRQMVKQLTQADMRGVLGGIIVESQCPAGPDSVPDPSCGCP